MTAPLQRPTWDETRIEQAKIMARRSLCTRAKVGAIITNADGSRVAGEGYNGPPSGYRHESKPCNVWCSRHNSVSLSPDYTDCPSLHAEANALITSDRSLRQGGTIYITSHPCFGCAKLIANSGIWRVVVSSDDSAGAYRNPLASYQYLISAGLKVELPGSPLMMARLASAVREASGGWLDDRTAYLFDYDQVGVE